MTRAVDVPKAARTMRETTLQDMVVDLARYQGFLCYHTYDSRKSVAGYLDLHLLGTWSMFRELKTERGVLGPEQKDWILRLRKAGGNADVWRPRDWFSGRIQEELVLLRKPTPARWPWGWLWTP